MKKIKQTIVTAVLKYYPPVVLGIITIGVILLVGLAFEAINQLFTPNLPIQYR
jgi:hypothetical protein